MAKKTFKEKIMRQVPSKNVIDKRYDKTTVIHRTPGTYTNREGKRDRENDPTSPMQRLKDADMKQENFFSGKRLKKS